MNGGIVILGATGTVGRQTLDVAARQDMPIVALGAGSNEVALYRLCLEHHPRYAALHDVAAAQRLECAVRDAGLATRVLAGREGLCALAALPEAACVMAGIVGAAGLLPTLEAIRAGKRVLVANKEVLVMAGSLLMAEASTHGAELIPIDSEHNAVFQCLAAGRVGLEYIALTASGGAVRDIPLHQLPFITPAQACRHPNWTMGRKISVDSATMVNKGLEVIEACILFDVAAHKVQVVLHPESIVHGLVGFVDGSVLAQLAHPDMRIPIAQALAFPGRAPSGASLLDAQRMGTLHFEAVDPARYPALSLCLSAAAQGGSAPLVLSAANEVAVEAFLMGRLPFTGIAAVLEAVMGRAGHHSAPHGVDDLLALDELARGEARVVLSRFAA